MWIDSRDCEPLKDGEYVVQKASGVVQPMHYTEEGGWNTHRTTEGVLCDKYKLTKTVVRWFEVPSPPKDIPEEWVEDWLASC